MRTHYLALALAASGFAFDAAAIDGELDGSFVVDVNFPGYGFYFNPFSQVQQSTVGALAKAPDGALWVIGTMDGAPGGRRMSVYRIGPNGFPDESFGGEDLVGLRTYVKPCNGTFGIADATVDHDNRLLVAVGGCGDFITYRFKANGDLDEGFAGNGILTVAFDKGGNNVDSIHRIAVAADNAVVMVGAVATATTRQLGFAHYDETGQPVEGIGAAGKRVIPLEWSLDEGSGVSGVRVLSDGRIVAAGELRQVDQVMTERQNYAVRIQPDGTMDGGFGNSAPGVSKLNYRTALSLAQAPTVAASWIGADGSVIHVGAMMSKQIVSDSDVFFARWRPDGLPDLSVGPSGTRSYALDFAGPAPMMASNNADRGVDIVPQGDGKFLIAANSRAGDGFPGASFVRLNADLTLDATFGIGGKARYIATVSSSSQHSTTARRLAVHGGRIVAVANVGRNGTTFYQSVIALKNDLLFADRFDD